MEGRQREGKEKLKLQFNLHRHQIRIDHVVENDMAMSKALSIAKEMLECGPLALGLAKKAIDRGMDVSLTDGLNIEGELYTETINTKDRAEGILAFNEKRKPKYKGQ